VLRVRRCQAVCIAICGVALVAFTARLGSAAYSRASGSPGAVKWPGEALEVLVGRSGGEGLMDASDDPGLSTSQAEVAFRAGEVLRARGEDGAARAAFRQAFEVGKGTGFRTRAQLELGHLQRRSQAWSSALDHYFELSHDESARREHRDAALYWQGVVWCELHEFDAARRTWLLVARRAQRMLDRVRAFDRLARLELNCGNQTAARAVLAVCDEALNPIALELTTIGASVRGALARMWSRRALAAFRSNKN
jgi:hypothetical protein